MLEFLALVQECAPTVSPRNMAAIVNVESGYNPYAIGVVGGRLIRQPRNHAEAVARALVTKGWSFSVGVSQINCYNFSRYNISISEAFEPCTNLRVGSKILEACYVRAAKKMEPQTVRSIQSSVPVEQQKAVLLRFEDNPDQPEKSPAPRPSALVF